MFGKVSNKRKPAPGLPSANASMVLGCNIKKTAKCLLIRAKPEATRQDLVGVLDVDVGLFPGIAGEECLKPPRRHSGAEVR